MKVLFVNTYYYPNMFGGAEQSVRLLALNNRESAVFSVDGNMGSGLSKELVEGITVYRSGSKFFDAKSRFNRTESALTKIKNRLADLYNPQALVHFQHTLDDFAPDVIHSNGLRGIGPQIWKIAYKRKIPILHTLRDYFVLDPLMRQDEKKIILKIWKGFFSYYSKYITAITAPSQFTLYKVLNTNFCKNTFFKQVLPNCVHYNIEEMNRIFSQKINAPVHRTTFIFVGALVKNKGILNLITAFNQMKEKNASLVICGTGDLQQPIELLISEKHNISYKGHLSKDALNEEYRKADVCVIPSLWEEPFGRVVIEAAVHGCALLASNRGGIPEIIKTLEAGDLFNPNDINELTQKMEYLCNESCRSQQLFHILKNINNYSLERQKILFDNLYQDLFTKC